MKSYRGRGPTAFETELLFRHVLNMEQVKNISKIIKALGKYMVLDRDMLNFRTGKTGLSYISKAVENGLIVEYCDQVQNKFIWNLGVGGIYFMESQGYFINKLKLDCDKYDRQRILTVNRYLIDKGYDMSTQYLQRKQHDIFIAVKPGEEKAIALYYSFLVKEERVREILMDQLGEGADKTNIEDYFIIEELKMKQEDIGRCIEANTVSLMFNDASLLNS